MTYHPPLLPWEHVIGHMERPADRVPVLASEGYGVTYPHVTSNGAASIVAHHARCCGYQWRALGAPGTQVPTAESLLASFYGLFPERRKQGRSF